MRTMPALFIDISADSTSCSARCMTGSRDVDWLHAVTSAFRVSGYWSGVVRCFSSKLPKHATLHGAQPRMVHPQSGTG